MSKFHNKNGSLTVYAFACGYVEEYKIDDTTLSLFQDGVWHVQGRNDNGRFVWESFDLLGQAREFFRQQRQALA